MGHIHGYPDNEKQWFDDLLGRGAGDPDMHGYPGEQEASQDPKGQNQNKNTTSAQTNQTSTITRNQKCIGQSSSNS